MIHVENVEPTPKKQEIEDILTRHAGKSRINTIRTGNCMTCDGTATDFKDELSIKEYAISGCCQSCQDDVFGEEVSHGAVHK